LEDELVRETILQVVSLKLWHTLSFGRLQVIKFFSPKLAFSVLLMVSHVCFKHLQMELCLNPELIKKWTKIKRKEAKEAKKAGQPCNPSEMLENKFLRNLIEEFLEVCLRNSLNSL
jgi:intron-binding protein aquarius